jgi:hypothetical protein
MKAARRSLVLPYRRDMPFRKAPTPEDTVTARRVLLDGLARDADIFELLSELAPPHPQENIFPGEVFLHLTADALNWFRSSRADPLPRRDHASGSCPSPPSADGGTPTSSAQYRPQRPSAAGPNRTCLSRPPGSRPTTSGSTPRSRRSPTYAPPPAGRAYRCARHARTWPIPPATQRHNDQFGTQRSRSSDRRAADHNGGYRTRREHLLVTVCNLTPVSG